MQNELKDQLEVWKAEKIADSNTGFFLISNTSVSNTRLKSTKNQANAKQDPEPECLLFENYPFFIKVAIQK